MCQESGAQLKRKELTSSLDKPNRDYQNYLAALVQWQARLAALEGESNNPASDTLHWLEQEYETITKSLPKELVRAQAERSKASRAVFAEKKSLVRFYEEVKKSIDQEISKYGTDLHTYNISIEAHLRFSPQFYDEFFRFVNQAVKGSFYGAEDGKAALKELVRVHRLHRGPMIAVNRDKVIRRFQSLLQGCRVDGVRIYNQYLLHSNAAPL